MLIILSTFKAIQEKIELKAICVASVVPRTFHTISGSPQSKLSNGCIVINIGHPII